MKNDAEENAERAARLEAVLNLAVDGIITIDERGNIETFNRAAEGIFGYAAEEVVGKRINMLMPEPYRSNHDRYMQRYHDTGERRIIGIGREVVGRRKDGSTFPMDLAVSQVELPGRRLYTGIVRDLTRQRRVETLAEVGRIASGLAHEIGTPMNIILGYAERLRQKSSEPKITAGLEVIIAQVERVSRLMDALLSYARRPALERRPMAFEPVARSVFAILGDRLRESAIRARLVVHPTAPLIEADKDRIEQVVLNLVVNAIDAMPSGGELVVSAEGLESPLRLRITISDTGVGIPVGQLAAIFEPFVTTKPTGKGTGLGLAVVGSIVREHGGTVQVESEVGLGTTFRIELPAQEPGVV